MLKRFLKKLGYTYRRIRRALKNTPNTEEYNKKLDQITDLIRLEKANFIKIYFADGSGFSETPCVPYGWQLKGESLSIPSQRGQRLNVFGIMSSDNELYISQTKSSINSAFVIDAIDRFAESPSRAPRSAIVLDNASVHHSGAFTAKIEGWALQGVEIFYLPTYSPHLNRIEVLWRKCKYEWLLPTDFESWAAIKDKLARIFANFGSEFKIQFDPF